MGKSKKTFVPLKQRHDRERDGPISYERWANAHKYGLDSHGRLSLYSNDFWYEHCVEPKKRNKDGFRWIVHRFAIKGGISIREAMRREMYEPNPLLNVPHRAETTNGR